MKIIEVWTTVKAVNYNFAGNVFITHFETKHCAQHCMSYMKANPVAMFGIGNPVWMC